MVVCNYGHEQNKLLLVLSSFPMFSQFSRCQMAGFRAILQLGEIYTDIPHFQV